MRIASTALAIESGYCIAELCASAEHNRQLLVMSLNLSQWWFTVLKRSRVTIPAMLQALHSLFEAQRIGLNVIAIAIAMLASYTAFSLAVKPAPAERIRYPWLIAAGVATGSGAWAVYLIIVLGYSSALPFALEFIPLALSLALAIAGCTIGIVIARNHDHMQIGGMIVGLAIASSFYAGMQGVEFAASKSWDPFLVLASLVLSASCGTAALSRGHLSPDIRGRFASTFMLAVGMVGTFLIGFAALSLQPDPTIALPSDTATAVLFGISLTVVVMLIIGLGFRSEQEPAKLERATGTFN